MLEPRCSLSSLRFSLLARHPEKRILFVTITLENTVYPVSQVSGGRSR
jgi:hypothetical protein